ncbi:MAG TPA: hypothetical protein VH083_14520 [Myxococcales bacterium]|nr:hypothetical protein [Myxococcales bacterium]
MRALACMLCLIACAKKPAAPAARIATTSGEIAIGNLSSQIDGQEALLKRQPASVKAMAAQIELLQARAQYTGSVGDFRRMAQLGDEAVRAAPGNSQALIARASARAALHRFTLALADLDAASDLKATRSARASILQAQGRLDQALKLRHEAVDEYGNTKTFASLAAAEGAAGDVEGALRDFNASEKAYRDVSPLPIAWLDFQRGLLFEAHARFDEAKAAYAAAAERLPSYAQAQSHLAGLLNLRGDRAGAEAILRPLVSLDDPEYEGQLAAVVTDRGEAARLRASAAGRYEKLLQEFPEAFADHAARFYLAFDAARALELARVNLSVRGTVEAYDLALSAAGSAGVTDCALSSKARALTAVTPRLNMLAGRVCPAAVSLK